jgi:hypothetical protein
MPLITSALRLFFRCVRCGDKILIESLKGAVVENN